MKQNTNYCFACREPNAGRDTVCIVDRFCHRECFKCLVCRQELSSRMFCSVMGDIYCDKHHPYTHHSHDVEREMNRSLGSLDKMDRIPQSDGIQCYCKRLCFVCRLIVDEPQPLRGPGGVYHGGCFRCFVCQKFLDAEQYRVVRRRFYCEPPCNSLIFDKSEHTNGPSRTHFTTKADKATAASKTRTKKLCSGCGHELISSDYYAISDKYYHRECFKCQKCNRNLTVSRSTLVGDSPYCQPDCEERIHRPSLPNAERREKSIGDQRSTSVILTKQEKIQIRREKSPKLGRKLEQQHSCVADAGKVAKIQRKLEEIQSSALEDKNCYTCGKKVYPAEQLNTLNRIYHLKCFQCKVCKVCLSNKYQILDGDPYCMLHFKLMSTIKSQSALNLSTATGKSDKSSVASNRINKSESTKTPRTKSMDFKHLKHQTAARSDQDDGTCSEHLCGLCSERIANGAGVKTQNQTYHRTCFRCHVCQVLLDPDECRMHDGIPHCENHYKMLLRDYKEKPVLNNDSHQTSVTKTSISEGTTNRRKAQTQFESEKIPKCYTCGTKVYQAEQLNILKRVYHRTCFKCATCQKVLSVTRYGVHEGLPYCTAHHKQITAQFPTTVADAASTKSNKSAEGSDKTLSRTRCFECGKYTYPKNSLILTDRVYHSDCLKCNKCQKSLGKWNFKEIDGVIFCARHHAEAVLNHLPSIR